ncbi:type II toxin-antitoxin system VapC family toxin [Leekyejoonella antrihumi]|uniref:Ribonuclease VapC n=1 Tax=Leekyejoonella antrihumi TaxID=1660198 RepID=A0A563DYF8_9MICO|nr:type II toxin-antitoxin system VapC family toxin [Leekyejoonella antrihumi]TWP34993.1 type II toxin-antitoxin system VapC family toxin [Leekyejoonella antrihumi]
MIVDTSVLVCLHEGEPDADQFLSAMLDATHLRMSAGTLIETCLVLDSRAPLRTSRRLDQLLADLQLTVVPVDEEQAVIARAAYRDYGNGSGHPAGLNFGDCFAYTLARLTREPLLFKGDDFSHTDITAALPR